MKKGKLLVILFSLLMFVSCVNGEVNSQQRNNDSAKNKIDMTVDQSLNQMNKIVVSGVIDDCKKLNTEQLMGSCEINILANIALKSGEIGECKKASSDSLKADCEDLYQQLIRLTNFEKEQKDKSKDDNVVPTDSIMFD